MVEEILWSTTQPSLRVPHQVELVRSDALPPADQISCAFVLAVDRSERVLLAYVNHQGRGWDVPGGHLDPGESARAAAVRELREETGFAPTHTAISTGGRVKSAERLVVVAA